MLKHLVPAAAVAALMSAAALAPNAALAAPAASLLSDLKMDAPAATLQVRDDRRRGWREWNGRRYYSGRRYRDAPPHWHRYPRRPYDWYGRGCIVVGPVWVCP